MLVLSRKLGESIEIGDEKIVVRVLSIKRSKVQLGVDAPPDVAIHRSETKQAQSDESQSVDSLDAGRKRVVISGEGALQAADDAARSGNRSHRNTSVSRSTSIRRDRFGASPRVSDRNGRCLEDRCDSEDWNRGEGQSLLKDLAKVQADIAALASLVSEEHQTLVQQLASDASERLDSLARTVRCARRDQSEQPIGRFLGARSRELRQTQQAQYAVDDPCVENGMADDSGSDWRAAAKQPTSVVREQGTPFLVSASPCSISSA